MMQYVTTVLQSTAFNMYQKRGKREGKLFHFFFTFLLSLHKYTHTPTSMILCSPFAQIFPQTSVPVIVNNCLVFGCDP